MKNKLGGLLIGGGALVLAVLGIPAPTVIASAQSLSSRGQAEATAQTFTLTNSGARVTVVGTSAWAPTAPAGTATAPAPVGSTVLTATAAKAALPKIPDLGGTPRSTAPLAGGDGNGGSGSTGTGSEHGNGRHHGNGKGQGEGTGAPGTVSGATSGLTSIAGSNAYDQGLLHPTYKTGVAQPLPGIDIEPPDQGLCSGNGYVMEVNNMVVQMYNSSSMTPLSAHGMALEKLFNAPEVFGGAGTGTLSVQGDPRCYFDPQTNRWFASQIWLTEIGASAQFGWAGEFVAVSTSPVPTGSWHVYFIPDQFNAQGVDHCNTTTNPCFGDQPLLGVNGNAVFISANEYTLAGKYPVGGVAAEYALSKSDLIAGIASPIYWNHLGDTVAQPGNPTCPFNTASKTGQPTQVICPWYSIVPAASDGAYVTRTGGTFYAMSSTTFTTGGSHGVALWQFTNTDAVTTGGAHVTGAVTVATTVAYAEPPHFTVHGLHTASESLAVQKLGPHPLGTLWKTVSGSTPIAWPTGEGMVATNTDRITTAAYDPANGTVWGALNTAAPGQTTAAVAWFGVNPHGAGSDLRLTGVRSGFLWAAGVSDFFPSIAFTNRGAGVMDYAIMGSSLFPSTGYSLMGQNGPDNTLRIARQGAGPEDGFTEYTATYNRPRWGDYSTAVATGGTFFFAAEMVNQTCTVTQFQATFTCGGTRDIQANWGTSVNRLSAGQGNGHGHGHN